MLWASGNGGASYPGVVSDGFGGLIVPGRIVAQRVTVSNAGLFEVINHLNQIGANISGIGSPGEMVLRGSLGLFNTAPPSAPTTGGAATAGGTYTAVEQAMLEACYTALQSIGLVT